MKKILPPVILIIAAASFAFATLVTRKLEVELELQGEKIVLKDDSEPFLSPIITLLR